MKKKKSNKLFWFILISLFVVYMGLYIASDRVTLNNKAIERFEKDVASGKNVTLDDYLERENKDYSNKISKLGLNISNKCEEFMTKGLSRFLKILGKLFS